MGSKDGAFDKNKMVDLLAFMFESLSLYGQSVGRTTAQVLRTFGEKFHFDDVIDEISNKLGEHPVLRFLVIATALSCAVPVATFVAFGLVSLIVTFTGFLLVEGVVLAVGGLCLMLCLMSMILIMSVLAVILGVSYFLAIKCFVLFKNYQLPSVLLRHLRPAIMSNGGHDISNSVDDVHQD